MAYVRFPYTNHPFRESFVSQKQSTHLADHRTPFIRNEWYVAALSTQVTRTMIDRQILGVGVLLFRTLDGQVAAIRNRCPHRSFPLSHGSLNGDTVVCGYHGLAFGPDGHCTNIPSQKGGLSSISARSYVVVEKMPFVWIWMGEPEKADPSTIPEHQWLSDPAYATFAGYLHCRSNYIRLHENVLDLTHFPYVHGEAVGGLDYIRAPFKVTAYDQSVVITRKLESQPVNPAYALSIGNAGHICNRTSESWFKTPAFHIAHATIEDLEGGVDGRTEFHFKIIHCFTPETAHSTHYFYANARDSAIENQELTARMAEMTLSTFMEDEVALELVERTWIDEDLDNFEEASVRGDLAGLHMRRIIAARAHSESA
jgi:phenylpropionate dioxygenase-like ring-hydroxylating dioxygenase large terminal subunit